VLVFAFGAFEHTACTCIKNEGLRWVLGTNLFIFTRFFTACSLVRSVLIGSLADIQIRSYNQAIVDLGSIVLVTCSLLCWDLVCWELGIITTNCRSFATQISFRKGDEGFILTNFKVLSPEKRESSLFSNLRKTSKFAWIKTFVSFSKRDRRCERPAICSNATTFWWEGVQKT